MKGSVNVPGVSGPDLTEKIKEAAGSGGWYGVCTTAAGTAEKAVTLDNAAGFTLKAGVKVTVKFTYATTSASATLNVDGTGAKDVFRYGSEAAASGAWMAGSVVDFLYDGTSWIMVGLHGVVPIKQGGTGADTSTAARNALGAQSKIAYGTVDLTAGSTPLADGELHVVYE